MGALLHVAGPMVDWLQLCTRCGYVLADYRNAAYLIADGPPRGWAEGAFIWHDGRCQSLRADDDGTVTRCQSPTAN